MIWCVELMGACEIVVVYVSKGWVLRIGWEFVIYAQAREI